MPYEPIMGYLSGGPVIYRPSPQENMLMLAKMGMRQSLLNEIEQDADILWQAVLKTDVGRRMTVEMAEEACRWWFAEGYSEHVHWRAKQFAKAVELV